MRIHAPRISTLLGAVAAVALTCGVALGKTKAEDGPAAAPTDTVIYSEGGMRKSREGVIISKATWDEVSFKVDGRDGSIGGNTVIDIVWGDAPRELAQGWRAVRARDGRAAKDAFEACLNAKAAGFVERDWVDELAKVGLGEAYLLLASKDDSAYAKAKEAFNDALSANAKSLKADEILRGLTDAELGLGDGAAAQKHADALVAAGRSARRPIWEVDGLLLRARAMNEGGNTAGAGSAYQEASRIADQHSNNAPDAADKERFASLSREAAARAGWVILDAAVVSRSSADFDKARSYFQSLAQKMGREPEVMAAVENAMGVIKFANDDAYGALRHFQNAEVKYFSVPGEVARSLYYQSKSWEKLGDGAMQRSRAKDLSDYYPKSEWARKL